MLVSRKFACQINDTYLAQHLRIAQDDHTVLCTGEGNVETTRVVQETDALVFVAAHTAQDDVVLLATLEGVDTRDLDLLVQILLQRPVELHVVDDIRPLSFVRRDDTNLTRDHTGLEELGYNLLDVRRLRSDTHVS